MKKNISIIYLGINGILVSFLYGLYSSGRFDLETLFIMLLSLNFLIILIIFYILFLIDNRRKTSIERERIRKEISELTEDEKNRLNQEKKKNSQEILTAYGGIFIFLIFIAIIGEYWENISNFGLGIMFLFISLIGSLFSSIFSIKGLLIIILILLIIIIRILLKNKQ